MTQFSKFTLALIFIASSAQARGRDAAKVIAGLRQPTTDARSLQVKIYGALERISPQTEYIRRIPWGYSIGDATWQLSCEQASSGKIACDYSENNASTLGQLTNSAERDLETKQTRLSKDWLFVVLGGEHPQVGFESVAEIRDTRSGESLSCIKAWPKYFEKIISCGFYIR